MGYSFDAEFSDLSIYEVFRAIPTVLRGFWDLLTRGLAKFWSLADLLDKSLLLTTIQKKLCYMLECVSESAFIVPSALHFWTTPTETSSKLSENLRTTFLGVEFTGELKKK